MTLYLRRDNADGSACFTVYDEQGYRRYHVDSAASRVAVKYLITTADSKTVVAKIRKLPSPTPAYVLRAGKCSITLVCVMSSKVLYAKIYGKNWHISGDMRRKDFKVYDVDNSLIMQQTHNNRGYELFIPEKANELYCLMLSVCAGMINTVDQTAVAAV